MQKHEKYISLFSIISPLKLGCVLTLIKIAKWMHVSSTVQIISKINSSMKKKEICFGKYDL